MKRDTICVGYKDSGLDLSGNDLAETRITDTDDGYTNANPINVKVKVVDLYSASS